jgi:phospholipase D1/2
MIFFSSLFAALSSLSYVYTILFVKHRAAIRQDMAHWKEKLGHTTIDLGIAPEKLESNENGELKLTDPIERLNSIRGLLVSYPLEFMSQENNMKPNFNESEFYVQQVFH